MTAPLYRLVALTLPELEALRDAFHAMIEYDNELPPLEKGIDAKLSRAVERAKAAEKNRRQLDRPALSISEEDFI